MIIASSPPASAIPEGPVEPVVTSSPLATATCANCGPSPPVFAMDADDDDEALQAVLLASMQAEAAQVEAVQQMSERAQKEQQERFDAAVVPPLVGKPGPLQAFTEECTLSDDVKRSLEVLGKPPQCLMLVKVRGDGHCLFRVVGAALVLGAAWSGHEARAALSEHLSQLATAEGAEVARLVLELVGEADVLAALNDEDDAARPAQLVGALRRCAIAHMRRHAERFRHCAEGGGEGEDGASCWEAYCESMAAPAKARYGGHPELVALSESLRVRVELHDAGALGGGMATYQLGEALPAGVPVVRGLRKGLHFNLLLKAQPERAPDDAPASPPVPEID